MVVFDVRVQHHFLTLNKTKISRFPYFGALMGHFILAQNIDSQLIDEIIGPIGIFRVLGQWGI